MNESDTIEARVRRVIASNLSVEVSEVLPTRTLAKDLGADSLRVVELVLAIEEEFEIDVPDEAVEGVATVQDVVNYVSAHAR
jgi:acyl carrier protein